MKPKQQGVWTARHPLNLAEMYCVCMCVSTCVCGSVSILLVRRERTNHRMVIFLNRDFLGHALTALSWALFAYGNLTEVPLARCHSYPHCGEVARLAHAHAVGEWQWQARIWIWVFCSRVVFLITTHWSILLSQGDAVKLRNDSGSQVGDRGFQFPPQVDSITALRHDTQEVHWGVGKPTAAGFRVVMGG